MDLTLDGLERCFNEAVNEGAEYVAPGIRIVGFVYGYSFSGIQHELGLLAE
ncbi:MULTISPECIES: hypothetical protein [Bacillus]|uniref:Uncharacterized protein n=1 Tax=Bacillus thuringiensis TaxID=1428 RepID=A0A4R4BEN7_BACTU|nr:MULTISPECIES: hypothetical protein [Bacillus]MED2039768.1 hypothetical protein [Bacillus wiedmannii]TCW55319.1 hypothetical protein EC917_106174 [Bacillus thuringiensis]TCW55468.1 hypothetical protein EC910_10679 [Bacillus thuringiensis]